MLGIEEYRKSLLQTSLNAMPRQELTHAETLTCEAGDLVFAPQTRAKHLMILLEGRANP